MNILITGASGFIGQHVLRSCLQQGHMVTACVRNPSYINRYFPDVITVVVDFAQDHEADIWLPRLQNIDIVINCVGIIRQQGRQTFESLHTKTPCALFRACEIANVKKVIQVSALGANDTAFSEYHLSKRAADNFLSQLNIEWTILMPSIVYGPGAKSMDLFKALAALPVTPLVDDGSQKIQPVHIDDLCRVVLKIIRNDKLSHRRIEVLGAEPISMRELYVTLKNWLGLSRSRFISIPYGVSLLAARLGGFMGNTPLTAEAVQMLRSGNTGNVETFSAITGVMPKSFKHAIFDIPPLSSEIVAARQFFLLPLLRVTLAFLWIATGFISAFVYPTELSYAMLVKLGIGDILAPFALYSAAALDAALGFALLVNYKVRFVAFIQIFTMVVYSALITIAMPELWAHPFGPILKNIPLIAATLVVLVMASNFSLTLALSQRERGLRRYDGNIVG